MTFTTEMYERLPASETAGCRLNLLTSCLKHLNYCVIQIEQGKRSQNDFILASEKIFFKYNHNLKGFGLDYRIRKLETLESFLSRKNYIACFRTKFELAVQKCEKCEKSDTSNLEGTIVALTLS